MEKLTLQQKKEYLLTKYVKRDYKVEDLKPKYVVFFNPFLEEVKEWTMVCICSTRDEALREILWRAKFHETNDGDLVLDNDARFKTFRDETKNTDSRGRTYEPGEELMKNDYSKSGNMLQIIASSTPEANSNTGFKGIGYYSNIETNYNGYYKIEEIYEII